MKKNLYILSCYIFILIACTKKENINPPPQLLSFNIEGVQPISTKIDQTSNKVEIIVPYQTSLKALKPIIQISEGEIIPKSGIVQDFSNPIYYTLSNGSSKVIYTVQIKVANQPAPEILSIKTDSVEAGFGFDVIGKNFGRLSLDLQASLIDRKNKETVISHKLIDSTKLTLSTTTDFSPDKYSLKIKVKDQIGISTSKVWISYPAPQLQSLNRKNLLNADTLWVNAKFIDSRYLYQLQLTNSKQTYFLKSVQNQANRLGFIIDKNVLAGDYEIKIQNQSEKKLSREFGNSISIFDPNKPFISEIFNPKSNYSKSDKIIFSTINFDKVSVRFYQVLLKGTKTYIQNGIYDATKKQLSIELPENIQTEEYQVAVELVEPTQNANYTFSTDIKIAVK